FSKHYKGYSDIINAQDYNMSMANILEAIGGKEGSILDTYGTGAELLRDNENIHVLNKRGHDNSVSIEYKKNLTGFELEEDTTELITRILPYAKYNDEEGNEITVKANYVDSSLISNYSHPFIKAIDYSDKFNDENIPTIDKLRALAGLEYKNNKVDIPKQNFKIEFIPLSKCVGYEALSDNISLCDTVTIKDTRYNINTQAKIIKVTYNVLKNRYESMELGEPRTTLGDIINNGTSNITSDDVKDIVSSIPSTNFPNTLPKVSILSGKSIGLASIELNWTFENKAYYSYELYGSKEKGFTPNSFNLIQEGQISSFLYQAKPNETWYFKVCAINSYGNRNNFSNEVEVSTAKINAEEWIENATIGNALIGNLSADKINTGTLKGNYIDARNLSVTDGNGKRTLDIDSFGNVSLDVTNFKIANKKVYTSEEADNAIVEAVKSEFEILDTKISSKVSEDDFGTLVEQNAYAVKIAWNNNSKYVQFESGGLAIYNGSISSSQKRAFFDEKGMHFWRDDYYLGKLGSNQYTGDSSLKGIVFDLEYQGAYTAWAVKDSSSSSFYTMRWTYCNKTVGDYTYGKLHAGCDIDMHYYSIRNVNFEGGGITGTLMFTQVVSMSSNGTADRWYNNSKLVFQNGILVDATWGSV
ncbi:MAG: phage tail protein, partial [Peptostreptococcaceae bacterium]|nr:phage tail protein [Peptostreptococcaceae bacterium]